MDELERLQESSLDGHWHRLVPLTPRFYPALYALSLRDQNSFRWRFRGAVPSPTTFEQSLFNGVLCQFVISPKDKEDLRGLVVAYNAALQDGICHVAAIVDGDLGAGGVEGVVLFVRYLLANW